MNTTRSGFQPSFPIPTDEDLLSALPHLRKRAMSSGKTMVGSPMSHAGSSGLFTRSPGKMKSRVGDKNASSPYETKGTLNSLRLETFSDSQSLQNTEEENLVHKANDHARFLEIARRELVREMEKIHRRVKAWESQKLPSSGIDKDIRAELETVILRWGGWATEVQNHASSLVLILKTLNEEASKVPERSEWNKEDGGVSKSRDASSAYFSDEDKALLLQALNAGAELEAILTPFAESKGEEENSLRGTLFQIEEDLEGSLTTKEGSEKMHTASITALGGLSQCLRSASKTIKKSLIPQVEEAKKIADLLQRSKKVNASVMGIQTESKNKTRELELANAKLGDELQAVRGLSRSQTLEHNETKVHLAVATNRVRHLQKTIEDLRAQNAAMERKLAKAESSCVLLRSENRKALTDLEATKHRQKVLEAQHEEMSKGMEALRRELITIASNVENKR
mmetsp:Transcript_14443/g.20172  ORF Transcript_14443/g.20172 Transcript_14443/m.20172 type:complete len:454 (+) Transcript_14443:181-1542(+)